MKSLLTHFSPVSDFYTPWKSQKTFGFLTFPRGIEIWHWTKMGCNVLAIEWFVFLYFSNLQIFRDIKPLLIQSRQQKSSNLQLWWSVTMMLSQICNFGGVSQWRYHKFATLVECHNDVITNFLGHLGFFRSLIRALKNFRKV